MAALYWVQLEVGKVHWMRRHAFCGATSNATMSNDFLSDDVYVAIPLEMTSMSNDVYVA